MAQVRVRITMKPYETTVSCNGTDSQSCMDDLDGESFAEICEDADYSVEFIPNHPDTKYDEDMVDPFRRRRVRREDAAGAD